VDWVLAALPAAPARVLEVGAGSGELAARVVAAGYSVVAIDPAGEPPVLPVALADLEEPAASFDAAVAVLSLHHVQPLAPSVRKLAEVLRPGGLLVVDEIDVAAFDLRAAEWLIERWREAGREAPKSAPEMVELLQGHMHPLSRLLEVLGEWFDLGEVERGPYLHRWHLDGSKRELEEELISRGELPVTGARFVGKRAARVSPGDT
jgi:SAM-dependent methyltransferase